LMRILPSPWVQCNLTSAVDDLPSTCPDGLLLVAIAG
jgi:hypothetical protein